MFRPRKIDIALLRLRTDLAVVVALIATIAPAAVAPLPIDSTAKADFTRMIGEAKASMLGDPVLAARLAQRAAATAAKWPKSVDRDISLATARWLEGEADYRLNEIAAARPLVAAALITVERDAPGSRLNADLLLSQARIEVEQVKPQIGLVNLQSAYEIFRRLGDARSQAKALQSIGSIYQDAQDFEKVIYYYGLAEEKFSADPALGLSARNNMANAYAQTGRPEAAMKEYKRALEMAFQLKSRLLEARILNNIADLQIDDRQFATAHATIRDGLTIANETEAMAERPTLLGTKARLDLAEGNWPAAVRAVEVAFAASTNSTTDQSYRPLHLTAYRAYKQAGDATHALQHLEAFRALDEAGRTLATSISSALIAARFDFANQKNQIADLQAKRLQADVALAQLEARQRTLLLAGVLALVAGASLFLLIYLKSLRRSRNETIAANLLLAQTNTELADALLAKSQFLATTSHEIRTPLNGILGMTQVMLADRTVTGALRDRIGLVNSAGQSMRTLVDDILDFAKIDAGSVAIETAAVDIAVVLPDLISLWRVEAIDRGIDLHLDLESGLEPISTDIVRLRQIIYNLLSNALKFTTQGSIRVTARRMRSADGEEALAIAFSDTGVGVPIEAFETIFEPFRQLDTSTTRRFGGTGLGLAISRRLARSLGGDITVESIAEAGSTFCLQIPYLRAAATVAPPPVTIHSVGTSPRLLIAGVAPIARSILRTRLAPYFGRPTTCEIEELLETLGRDGFDIVMIDAEGLQPDRLTALMDELGHIAIPVALLVPSPLELRSLSQGTKRPIAVVVKPVAIEALAETLLALGSDPARFTSESRTFA